MYSLHYAFFVLCFSLVILAPARACAIDGNYLVKSASLGVNFTETRNAPRWWHTYETGGCVVYAFGTFSSVNDTGPANNNVSFSLDAEVTCVVNSGPSSCDNTRLLVCAQLHTAAPGNYTISFSSDCNTMTSSISRDLTYYRTGPASSIPPVPTTTAPTSSSALSLVRKMALVFLSSAIVLL